MSNKHDANVQKSTLVNFQIGLIASLLFAYFMFEVYTAVPVIEPRQPRVEFSEEFNFSMEDFIIEEEPKKELAVKVEPQKVINHSEPEIVEDDRVLRDMDKEFKNEIVEVAATVNPSDIEEASDPEPEEVPFVAVEFAPVFPGCERLKTNSERASCFSEKIKRIVAKKFDTRLGDELGLSGIQRIHVQFDVYKDGTIKNIKTRAPHPLLEKEAKRVVKSFPTMTPGRQRDRAVTVKYQLPIVFKIQN